jgi:hypothetical protein
MLRISMPLEFVAHWQVRARIANRNGAPHPDASSYAKKFSGKYSHRIFKGGIGHNLPQEAPQEFAKAIVDVDRY